jgi:hypothetical protein
MLSTPLVLSASEYYNNSSVIDEAQKYVKTGDTLYVDVLSVVGGFDGLYVGVVLL